MNDILFEVQPLNIELKLLGKKPNFDPVYRFYGMHGLRYIDISFVRTLLCLIVGGVRISRGG